MLSLPLTTYCAVKLSIKDKIKSKVCFNFLNNADFSFEPVENNELNY